MKEYKFVITVAGSASGNVFANNKKEAAELIEGGQWQNIDIDVESVTGIDSLSEVKHKAETKFAGSIGGEMVRKAIEQYEKNK